MQAAQAAFLRGNLTEAETQFKQVLQTNPGNVDANANLGSIYFLRQNWAASADRLHAALEKQPALWKAKIMLGLCSRRLGRESQARELLAGAIPHLELGKFKTRAEVELIESLYQAGDFDQASIVLANAQRESPRDSDVLYIAYWIHTDLADQARDALRVIAPDSGRFHQMTAQHLVNRGDLTGAIHEYESAIKADPQLRGLHYELGEAYSQESSSPQSIQRAENEFRAAITENPSDANAEAQLGMLALARGNTATAIIHFQTSLRIDGSNALGEQGIGKALLQQDSPAEALPHLERAMQLDSQNPNIRYQLATVYRKLGRSADAERELTMFHELHERSRKSF